MACLLNLLILQSDNLIYKAEYSKKFSLIFVI